MSEPYLFRLADGEQVISSRDLLPSPGLSVLAAVLRSYPDKGLQWAVEETRRILSPRVTRSCECGRTFTDSESADLHAQSHGHVLNPPQPNGDEA